MDRQISIETVQPDIGQLLNNLQFGETVTFVGPEGTPVALLVSLNPKSAVQVQDVAQWQTAWNNMAQDIGNAWIGDKSALESLSEMRR